MDLEKMAKEIADKEKAGQLVPTTETSSNSLSTELSFEDLNKKFLQKQVENGATLQEISEDYVKGTTTMDILNDKSKEGEDFKKDLKKEQKEILKESFKQDKVKKQKLTLEEKQSKAEAFYNGVRPILEFDFSNLIHKKVGEKDKDKIEDKKTYKDRSYGIPLMVGMLCVLTLPYFLISIILAVFNGINAMLEEIATFGKISRYIVLSIVIIVFAILIIYGGIRLSENIFKFTIIK